MADNDHPSDSGEDGREVTRLTLRIDADWQAIQAYYLGDSQRISGRARDGRRVVLPASALRPFLKQSGVHGWFEMLYEPNEKRLLELRRISD